MSLLGSIIVFIVGFVLTQLLAPDPAGEDARPGENVKFPTNSEGRVIPKLWGTAPITPNINWSGNFDASPIRKSVKKNLWSSTSFITGYEYRSGIQLGCCRGPAEYLGLIFGEELIDETIVSSETGAISIDKPDILGGPSPGNGGIQFDIEFYSGTDSQPASPYLEIFQAGPTNTQPRYVGDCYLVLRRLGQAFEPLIDPNASQTGQQKVVNVTAGAYLGNVVNIKIIKPVLRFLPAEFPGQTIGHNKIGDFDCNPVTLMYEVLVRDESGYQRPAAEVDTVNWNAASQVMVDEGLGMTLLLDTRRDRNEIMQEIERFMDGVLQLDPTTGLWVIKLARADFDVATIPEFNLDNCKVIDFQQGSWDKTQNHITITYVNRADEYKDPATAHDQDQGNMLTQGGGSLNNPRVVPVTINYPTCYVARTASKLAAREQRQRGQPLAAAEVEVSQEFRSLLIGDAIVLNHPGAQDDPVTMRVLSIEKRKQVDGILKMRLQQDTYADVDPVFAPDFGSLWEPPSQVVPRYLVDSQLIINAPRGILTRDPEFGGDATVGKLFFTAPALGTTVSVNLNIVDLAGIRFSGTLNLFPALGTLAADLEPGQATPLATLQIVEVPDDSGEWVELLPGAEPEELGTELSQLIYVGDSSGGEFMLVEGATQLVGLNVNLTNVHRGVLGTGQQRHTAGTNVWLVSAGSSLSTRTFVAGAMLNAVLQPVVIPPSTLTPGSNNPVAVTMNRRPERPYPPAAILYNGTTVAFGIPNADGDGTGLNGVGFEVALWRRVFDVVNEVDALTQDTDPGAGTTHRVQVIVDPDGANVTVYDSGFFAGDTSPTFVTQHLLAKGGPIGTLIEVRTESQRDVDGTLLLSETPTSQRVLPTSARSGQAYMGSTVGAAVSGPYNVPATGNYQIDVGVGGSIDVIINGGTPTPTASGSSLALTAGEILTVRRNSGSSSLHELTDLGTTFPVAYGVTRSSSP